jgi:hypothetical protein
MRHFLSIKIARRATNLAMPEPGHLLRKLDRRISPEAAAPQIGNRRAKGRCNVSCENRFTVGSRDVAPETTGVKIDDLSRPVEPEQAKPCSHCKSDVNEG